MPLQNNDPEMPVKGTVELFLAGGGQLKQHIG
jgi:hypothetical protein